MAGLVATGTKRDQVGIGIFPRLEKITSSFFYLVLTVMHFEPIMRATIATAVIIPFENLLSFFEPLVRSEQLVVVFGCVLFGSHIINLFVIRW
jgi:hypothetical protein